MQSVHAHQLRISHFVCAGFLHKRRAEPRARYVSFPQQCGTVADVCIISAYTCAIYSKLSGCAATLDHYYLTRLLLTVTEACIVQQMP